MIRVLSDLKKNKWFQNDHNSSRFNLYDLKIAPLSSVSKNKQIEVWTRDTYFSRILAKNRDFYFWNFEFHFFDTKNLGNFESNFDDFKMVITHSD